ncbi:uncharacterized protein LOC135473658 [Liolophura sinensis]|uniref:uncharacterized protein LOC135473658 n=1 Tax=Liolophura sinensis TaxID=3198878 RepID=UPI0031583596
MESSSAPLTPGKNRKPCPSCSPVKYEGGTTYVCSSPVVIVQQMLPKAGHSSQRRIDVECTPGETKETAGISDDLQNKSKKSSKRGRPKLALRKGTKGIATMPPKLSSLSQPGNILNAVDLNESDDFRPSITTRSNKRRKLSDTDKAKIKIPYSDEVFSEASRSRKAGSDLTGSRNGKSQIGSSEISGLEPTRSKKASAEGESLDVPISRKERSRIGSSEIESSAIPLKVASLEIGCNSLEAGTPGLATNQVCGTESEWDVDGVHNSAKVTVESEPPLAKGDESTEEMKSCVICRQSVKSDNLQSHQRACLNRHFTRGANPADASAGVSDEVLARALQQTELMQSSPPLELVLCQICNLDLSGLNAHRQTQHVNTCMDKKETAVTVAVADSEAMERARKAVLDCPMCGKPLKTEASRKSHMNRCSKSCNVGQDHLSQLIEQQRREHEARLTAGQIPLTTRAQKTKNRGQSAKTKRTTKALDEDTQFALALSTSLVEEQQKQETQLLDQLESIDRLALGCKKLDKDIKKGRRKKGNSHIGEELPLLLKYTTEEIRKKIAERVAMVVTPGDSNHFNNTPPMSESDVTKRFSKNTDRQQSVFNGTERTNLSLWKKSCMNSDTADIYYVKELSPLVKVSTAHFDRLLAKMSALAGTGKTDKNSGNLSKVEDTEIGDEASSVDFVSTQTAVVLAELAAEEDESVLQSSPKCTSQNLTRISSSQSTADRDCKNQTSTSLVKSFNHASKKSQISKSAPGKNACSLDIEGATCLSELHSSGVEEVVKLGGDNYANGSDNNTSEEPEEEATSRADNCGVIKVAAQEGNSWGNESGNEFFDSKKTSFSFDASGFCPEDKSKVDPTIITQSLLSQLSFLVNNPIFSDIRLLTGDQKVVHAHRVILAARCPRLIQDLQQTSEDLHLEEFTCRAVLNVIKFIYAGEIVISRNCEEEIQLAQRFGVEELCDILQHRVGDKWEPNADADEDKTLEKEQVLDDLLNSLFDGSMGAVVQETNGENLEEGKDEEEMDSLYQFMSTQREKSSANKGDNSKKGQEYLGCTSIKQIGFHSAGQEIKVNKGVVLSLSSDISRPGIQRITEPLGKPNMKRLEEIVGDISCRSHTGSSEQRANQSSHSHRPEKDIYEYKAVEQSVTSNDDNEIEENKCRSRSSGCSAESDMGRGLKRVIVSHCDEDGAMETVCKRVKLDGPSSDGKSDLDLTSQVDLMDTSKSSSVTDLYDNDENHFDIVHSMLNELSPGEAEKYQPDWFKSSSSGSSEHAKSEKDDEDLKLQHDMNVGVAGDNLDEEERKSGDELIVIDVNAMEDINNEAKLLSSNSGLFY